MFGTAAGGVALKGRSASILAYFVPYNFFALKADTFPAMPSFLRAGICGQGTDYACPSEWVPIPHGGSLHITPDDPRLPVEVRARQGLSGTK